MAIDGAPAVACHSLGPELWQAWAPDGGDGRVSVAVTRILPPEVVGMGSGRVAAATSFAIQTKDAAVVRGHGLADLRLGDLVAVRDWDATHYTGYRDGGLTVGVVAAGDSPLAGNGPAVTVLLSAADGSLAARVAREEVHGTKSHHHQGVERIGKGLEVTGWATIDDLPEAIEDPTRQFALGVQWHPEAREDDALFEALIEEARTYRAERRASRS
jgi:hypothetical protein